MNSAKNSQKSRKASRVKSGKYEYRGATIERNDCVQSGKYGAWDIKFLPGHTQNRIKVESKKQSMDFIDEFLGDNPK